MKNNTLFIMGNGPSLKEEHFELVRSSGVATLGMNAAYRYWWRIGWWPDIYACLDDQVVVSHAEAIAEMVEKKRCQYYFLHQEVLRRFPGLAGNERVRFLAQLCFGEHNRAACEKYGLEHKPGEFFRSTCPSKVTTGSYSTRFAAHLGFERIGLIGTDCRYVQVVPGARPAGGIVLEIERAPERNPNYFFDDYQQPGDRYNVPNPESHQGNLHLQSFQTLAEDIRFYGWDLKVSVCSAETALHEESVFPLVPIETFLARPRLSAVFVPFTARELPRLEEGLARWGQAAFAPHIFAPEKPDVELHFAMNGVRDEAAENTLTRAWEQAGLSRHFAGCHFHYSDLTGERDLYARDRKGPHGPEGYIAGPNNQFFDIIRRFSTGMSHIAVLESDAVPIRANWLAEMERLAAENDGFWICGSVYRGRVAIPSVTHINGNALYHVGDAEFRAFFENQFLPYFYRRVQQTPDLSYDVVLFDLFQMVHLGMASPELLALWKNVAHRFRFSDWIVDVSHGEDRQPEALCSLKALKAAFPRSYFVHGAVEGVFRGGGNSFPMEECAVEDTSFAEWALKALRCRWEGLKDEGVDEVYLFGAGQHTRWLLDMIEDWDGPVIAGIMDDHAREQAGWNVKRPEGVSLKEGDVIVLSSDVYQKAMMRRCQQAFGAGMRLIDLYEKFPGRGPYPKITAGR